MWGGEVEEGEKKEIRPGLRGWGRCGGLQF